jgi:hypothetical protein
MGNRVICTMSVLRCYKQEKSKVNQSRVAVTEAEDSSGTRRKGKSTVGSHYQATIDAAQQTEKT